ncbi:hypothetical protein GCM10022204_31160 [Microlunatus aurantiacus]|uniref:Transglycosylase SLT domain-containing protein n=1 Tax=Microlunatus aurantiacus TaxID=446786 RepID=A0ABP7E0F4_9ACTN
MSAVAAGVAVTGLTGGAVFGASAPVTAAPSTAVSVDTSVRDQRVTRGDLRPQMATTEQRRQAAQRVAELGEEGASIEVREAKLEAKKKAAAKKKALAKKKAAAEKKRKEAAAKKAELARIKELGYEPGTSNPRDIAKQILKNKYGYGNDQYQCFNNIIIRESNWDIDATNASSGAYGIPQSLPGNKMASVGDDWRTNPATQITWGIEYMKDRYGSPCSAWGFKSSHGWY